MKFIFIRIFINMPNESNCIKLFACCFNMIKLCITFYRVFVLDNLWEIKIF